MRNIEFESPTGSRYSLALMHMRAGISVDESLRIINDTIKNANVLEVEVGMPLSQFWTKENLLKVRNYAVKCGDYKR